MVYRTSALLFLPVGGVLPTRSRASAGARGRARCAPRAALNRTALARRSYQLEEMEDSANQTSAIYLRDDGVVTLGETDGPAPDKSQGSWSYDEQDGLLTLELERWFGNDAVPFSVKRILRGHPDSDSDSLALFQGAMFREPTDFSSEEALGHFALVQAVDDLPREDYDITQK